MQIRLRLSKTNRRNLVMFNSFFKERWVYMVSEMLVSVVVITYNSADYVIETLESIKGQTYPKIELIVSDDASVDETITVVRKWIDVNKGRFVKYKVVESETNKGINFNCNRGIMEAAGDYIKPIAGDDLLSSDCIEKLLDYSLKNNLNFAYAKVIPFTNPSNPAYEAKLMENERLMYEIFALDVKQQYRKLLTGFNMYTIGLFLKKDFFHSIGGFDEKYKMMEDYPFAVKVTSMGYRLNLLNNYVVKYRVRSAEEWVKFFSSNRSEAHIADMAILESQELIPRLRKERMYIALYDLFIRRLALRVKKMNSSLVFFYISKIIGYLAFSKISMRIKMINHNRKNVK